MQTADILWNWFHKARAKNQRCDVVITKDEQKIHLAEVKLDGMKLKLPGHSECPGSKFISNKKFFKY